MVSKWIPCAILLPLVSNIVDRTSSAFFFVSGASVKLLIFLYALSRTEIKLRTAIGTVEQTRKQTLSARGGISSATIAEFLNAIEGIFRSKRLGQKRGKMRNFQYKTPF